MKSDPTDWRTIALRFADRGHRPEWHPEDRPPWPGNIPSEALRVWVGQRLEELDALVREEQRTAIDATLTPEHLATMADALRDPKWGRLDGMVRATIHKLTRGGARPEGRAMLNELKRLDEPLRRGRTRGEEPGPEAEAIEAAAWDIWKLRHVIAPRFWPSNAVGAFKLAKDELAKVAAKRRDCDVKEVARAYSDKRIANSYL